MSRTRRPVALITAAGAALALGAAAGPAQAVTVPCFTKLPGPTANSSWELQNDGGMAASFKVNTNSALDTGYGSIKVGGVAYPNAAQNCDKIGDVVNYPKKTLGGFEVSRSVSVTNGRLRWVDTIRNPSNASKPLAFDFALEVLGSQDIIRTESGDQFGTSDDHWSVHKSGALFSFSQWGEGSGAIDPILDPEDDVPTWEPFAGVMGDAALHYGAGVPALAPGQTMRFLHAAGATTAGEAAAVTAASDSGAPFLGFSKALAAQIVNWSPDPDKDGVDKFKDECPGVKGNLPTGCIANQPPPPPADPSDPDVPGNPADPGTGGGSGSGGGTGTGPGQATAPRATLAVPKKLSRKALTRGLGIPIAVKCDVGCKTTVSLSVRKLKAKTFKTLKSVSRTGFSVQSRKLRIKVRSAQLKGLQPAARIVVKVTGQNGVSTTFTRSVRFVK
jgi:hypothetical protein